MDVQAIKDVDEIVDTLGETLSFTSKQRSVADVETTLDVDIDVQSMGSTGSASFMEATGRIHSTESLAGSVDPSIASSDGFFSGTLMK